MRWVSRSRSAAVVVDLLIVLGELQLVGFHDADIAVDVLALIGRRQPLTDRLVTLGAVEGGFHRPKVASVVGEGDAFALAPGGCAPLPGQAQGDQMVDVEFAGTVVDLPGKGRDPLSALYGTAPVSTIGNRLG